MVQTGLVRMRPTAPGWLYDRLWCHCSAQRQCRAWCLWYATQWGNKGVEWLAQSLLTSKGQSQDKASDYDSKVWVWVMLWCNFIWCWWWCWWWWWWWWWQWQTNLENLISVCWAFTICSVSTRRGGIHAFSQSSREAKRQENLCEFEEAKILVLGYRGLRRQTLSQNKIKQNKTQHNKPHILLETVLQEILDKIAKKMLSEDQSACHFAAYWISHLHKHSGPSLAALLKI